MSEDFNHKIRDYIVDNMGMPKTTATVYTSSYYFEYYPDPEDTIAYSKHYIHIKPSSSNNELYYHSCLYDEDTMIIAMALNGLKFQGRLYLELYYDDPFNSVKTLVAKERFNFDRFINDVDYVDSATVLHDMNIVARFGTPQQLSLFIESIKCNQERLQSFLMFADIYKNIYLKPDEINNIENRMIIIRFRNENGIGNTTTFELSL